MSKLFKNIYLLSVLFSNIFYFFTWQCNALYCTVLYYYTQDKDTPLFITIRSCRLQAAILLLAAGAGTGRDEVVEDLEVVGGVSSGEGEGADSLLPLDKVNNIFIKLLKNQIVLLTVRIVGAVRCALKIASSFLLSIFVRNGILMIPILYSFQF